MSLPLAHETWFLDDEENYDWDFLTEPATLANIVVGDIDAADDFIVGQDSVVKATVRSLRPTIRLLEIATLKTEGAR